MIKFYDTSSLLTLQEEAFKEKFYCSDVTFKELADIISSPGKLDDLKHRAKKLSDLFDKNQGIYSVCFYQGSERESTENKIIETAVQLFDLDSIPKNDFVFISDNLYCRNVASVYGIRTESASEYVPIYKGYRELTGTTDEINKFFETVDRSTWYQNEYLVVKDTELGNEFEMRFDNGEFVYLKLPPAKYIKAKNALQRCALDILNNPKITAVAILGGYGSGKTFLSMQMALYAVREKGWQSRILGVREVLGEGAEIGYLPGDKEDKLGNFFLPLVQQLNGGEIELESLKRQGVLEVNSPYFLKGTTYHGTVIVVDEAEDLSRKQIKLVGTRAGEDSRVIFAGDYKQSVIDSSESNALVHMCNILKGDPKFACIYLGEDVRSSTSRMFANLF